MRLGLYIIASIVLMSIVGIFVYTINPGNYTIEEFGIPVTIPVAVWVVIPMLILMLASVVHMIFYSTKNFFKFKKWENDTLTLDDALYWSLLNDPKAHKFNIPLLKQTASLLSVASVKVNGAVEDISDKLRGALTLVSEIDRGEYVDLKARKLATELSSNNPLVIKNLINHLNKDENFAEEVLQNIDAYDKQVVDKALNLFAQKTNFTKAKKYINIFDKEAFITLLTRVTRNDKLELTKEILDEFITHLEPTLECSDYLRISTLMMHHLSPDDNLKLWREYEKKYFKAEIAYLYLLFEYEMIDKAGEYLDEHNEDEFKRFRALYDLKKEHKKYKITDLMNIRHICDA